MNGEQVVPPELDPTGPGEYIFTGPDRQAFELIPASELTKEPTSIHWLLKGIIEENSLNLIFGEPAAGKSLFVLDWAFCITAGIEWNGSKTKQAEVIILAGEGFSGMKRRLAALEQKYQIDAPSSLLISRNSAQLLDEANAEDVAQSIQDICSKPGLIVIDTLHRNMIGDENSASDIGTLLQNIDRYFKPTGAAILIVHHSGHVQRDRSRGSSSIRGAMDAEFSVNKNGNIVTLSCHKAKDFDPPKPQEFKLVNTQINGWIDEDGQPQTSVILEHIGESSKQYNKPQALTGRNQAILNALYRALEQDGIQPSPDIKNRFAGFEYGKRVVHIDHWRKEAYRVIAVDSTSKNETEAKRKAFERAQDTLLKNHIQIFDAYCWIINDYNPDISGQDPDKLKTGVKNEVTL